MTDRALRPWRHFADTYFADSPAAKRVDSHFTEIKHRYDALGDQIDTFSDDLGRALIEKRILRADFEKALDSGIEAVADAPAELVAFMESATRVPQWLDMASVERGAEVFRQLPSLSSVVHSVIAGFLFAAIDPNAAITLSLNKNLIGATHRRYIQSFKYMADASAPGGLQRFAPGFKAACRVRLVHGFVRSEIAKHYDWNYKAYRSPINNGAVLHTALITSSFVIPYAESAGMRFTPQEKEDLCMHTAYLALLQGVPPEHIPTTFAEASEYTYYFLQTMTLPLPADRARANSVFVPLTTNGFPISQNKLVLKIFNGYLMEETWRVFGKDICTEFGMPRYVLARLYAPLIRSLNHFLSSLASVKLLKPYYVSYVRRFWDNTVPVMLERLTGQSDVSFAQSAKSQGNA